MKEENNQLVMAGLENKVTEVRNSMNVFKKRFNNLIDLKSDFISWKIRARNS